MNEQRYENFLVSLDTPGVFRIILDVPGKPLNVLTESVMRELDLVIHALEREQPAAVVSFESGKESGFLAGADVSIIQNIASAEESDRLIRAGQELFDRIERLPMPTVAIIHGPCLGGGLELSLACRHRIARDNSSTQIGLPEIKLGLIPGWGGTQRLPKLVGTPTALKMILQGKTLSADKALRCGLIDRAIAPDDWERAVTEFLTGLLTRAERPSRPTRPWAERLLDSNPLGRAVMFHMTRRSIRSQASHYPALHSAIRAVADGWSPSRDGFETERVEFAKLLESSTSRNLMSLFFSRERARKPGTWTDVPQHVLHDHPIRRVGVIGGGAMGSGIAMLAASRGFDVCVREIHEQAAQSARERIEKLIRDRVRHKRLSDSEKRDLESRVSVSCDAGALSGSDLYIEAIVERMETKQSLFRELANERTDMAILSSNTSSLSVAEMASVTDCSSMVAGLHFFNPVHRMELVEVVRAPETDDATVAKLIAFVRALGKTPVVTADSPGFLVNRVLFPYLGEAIRMVSEGYEVDRTDREVRRFGMPMGPLELLDHVGIDVAFHVSDTLRSTLKDADCVIDVLSRMAGDGKLGIKTGVGFYDHRGKKRQPAASPSAYTPREPMIKDFDEDGLSSIQRRLVYPMLAEAVRCQEEGVVESPWSIDLAMVLGTGFAPHLGGPMSLIDSIGPDRVMRNLMRLRQEHGSRFEPPRRLVEMADGVTQPLPLSQE